MNKKILILILTIFGISFLVATYFYFKNPPSEESVFTSTKKEYDEPLREEYTLVENAHLYSTRADTTILVRFNNSLYAKALEQSTIEGNLNYEGIIDVIVEDQYVPFINGETNCVDYLNAIVVRASQGDLVLQKNNQLTLFYIISEY